MTSDPYSSTAPMIQASILSADFSKLAWEVGDVLAGGADFLHLDIMDGHFVPNISFGPHVIEAVSKSTTCYRDCHLMISDPVKYAAPLVEAGANSVTFHIEATSDPTATAGELKKLGCRVGVTLKPGTAVETVFPVLDLVDLVLVMSVEPGFGGQKFMADQLRKAEVIKKRLGSTQRLQIDGGIKADNIRQVQNAGIDWFVVGSAIFDPSDRKRAIDHLRSQFAR